MQFLTVLKALLKAILDDDAALAARVARDQPGIIGSTVSKPQLYRGPICHWLYVGDTALHLAAAGYRVEIVKALLAAGADPNAAANHRRGTPLHYAADGAVANSPMWDPELQVKTIELLVKAGANINAQDKNGATPLHRAVRTRCLKAVRALLAAGADPTLKNKPGSTPFHLAVQNTGRGGSGSAEAIAAQKQIIEEFLSLGLKPDIKTAGGKTVRDCARSSWIQELLPRRF